MQRRFREVDVFTATPFGGNPVAVVLDSDGLSTSEMQRFANWTNLSETTFVLPPSTEQADYQVRIFTPSRELPFAGHPTLGTCHAWLEAGGKPALPEVFIQECGAGLVEIRQVPAGLAFAAPPLIRSGPVEEPLAEHLAAVLGISRADITDLAWADNGPGWVAVLLPSAEAVLALRPGAVDMDIGVAGFHPAGSPAGHRGPGLLPQRRRDDRGPGDREPECLAGAVAAGHRPGQRALCGGPGHGPGTFRAGAHLPRGRRPDLGRWRHPHLRVGVRRNCRG